MNEHGTGWDQPGEGGVSLLEQRYRNVLRLLPASQPLPELPVEPSRR